MSDEKKVVVKNMGSGFGIVWPIGWLFTIGYCQLGVREGLFALILWPYYLGIALRS